MIKSEENSQYSKNPVFCGLSADLRAPNFFGEPSYLLEHSESVPKNLQTPRPRIDLHRASPVRSSYEE